MHASKNSMWQEILKKFTKFWKLNVPLDKHVIVQGEEAHARTPLPLFSSQLHPKISLRKKEIPHHIKISANA
jgi:hypothetical protein